MHVYVGICGCLHELGGPLKPYFLGSILRPLLLKLPYTQVCIYICVNIMYTYRHAYTVYINHPISMMAATLAGWLLRNLNYVTIVPEPYYVPYVRIMVT